MKWLRRIAVGSAAVFGCAVVLLGATALLLETSAGKAWLASFASRLLSNGDARVKIGRIEGSIYSSFTIERVVVEDRAGAWLEARTIKVSWSPSRLLRGGIDIDSLRISHVAVMRRPVGAAPSHRVSDGEIAAGSLGSLPEVNVGEVSIDSLDVAKSAFGEPARLSLSGTLRYPGVDTGLSARVEFRRLGAAGGHLRLDVRYAPARRFFAVMLDAEDGSDDLFARMAGLKDFPQARAVIRGSGTWDAWDGSAEASAGGKSLVSAKAQIRKSGDDHVVALAVDFDRAPFLPSGYASALSAGGRARLRLRVGPRRGVTVEAAHVEAADARLDIAGSIAPAFKALNLRFSLRADAARTVAALVPDLGWTRLALTGTVTGPPRAPLLSARLSVSDPAFRQYRAGAAILDLAASPVRRDGRALRYDLKMSGSISGVGSGDPRVAAILPRHLELTAAGMAAPDGAAALTSFSARTEDSRFAFDGRASVKNVRGKVSFEDVALAPFSRFAGRPLEGKVSGEATLSADIPARQFALKLDGRGAGISAGVPAIDRLTGRRIRLAAQLRRATDGVVTVDHLDIESANAIFALRGRAGAKAANLEGALDLPSLSQVDSRLAGSARAAVALTGSLTHPRLAVRLSIPEARAMDQAIEGVVVELAAEEAPDGVKGTLAAQGKVGGRPLTGNAVLAQTGDGGARIDDLRIALGSARLTGQVRLTAGRRAEGRLVFEAGDLEDIQALVLTKLSGRLHGALTLSAANGQQAASLVLTGAHLAGPGFAAAELKAVARVDDAFGARALTANGTLQRVALGGTALPVMRVAISGNPGSLRVTLDTSAGGAAIRVAALADLAAPNARVRIERLLVTKAKRSLRLVRPAMVALGPQGVAFSGVTLASGAGTLRLDGSAGARLDLRLAADRFPLGVAEIVAPTPDIDGALSGTMQVTGSTAAPAAQYRLHVAGLRTADLTALGAGPFTLDAHGTATRAAVEIDARLADGHRTSATIAGTMPLAGGRAIALSVRGKLDLAAANAVLSARGMRVSGPTSVDLKVSGPLAAPAVAGTVALKGGRFDDPVNGIVLRQIDLEARAAAGTLTITRLAAVTPNGGTIAGSGRVGLDPRAGFPGEISLRASNALLIANDIVSAVGDLRLEMTGPLAREPRVTGQIALRNVDVSIPGRVPGSATRMRVRHVNVPAHLRGHILPLEAARKTGPSQFAMQLDLAVSAPVRVFVRGRGVDAELGGRFTVRGSPARPVVDGALDLKRGALDLFGTRLNFTRGRLTFPGKLDPTLDFVAETQSQDVVATVTISGSASDPKFAFTSTPALPQDEILARILFGQPTTELTKSEAIRLAQAAAQLSGAGGSGLLDRVRKKLGVDVLDIGTSAQGAPQVTVGRRISRHVNVGVSQGTDPTSSRGRVSIDITRNLKLQGEVGADGSTSLGIGAEWNY